MALTQVVLTLDVYDGTGTPIQEGSAFLMPTAQLVDTTDHVVVWQRPVTVALEPPEGASESWLPTVTLYSCDNASLSPSGWMWQITFQAPGAPPQYEFALDYSNGASQYLSQQTPVVPTSGMASYALLSGAAFTGQVAAPDFSASGLAGAASPSRYVGSNLNGPPLSGTFTAGDWGIDKGTGAVWVCVLSGSPGVWRSSALYAAQTLTPWRAALGNRASARCDVVCLGDSITEGQHATSETLRWLACLRTELRSRFPFAGQPAGGRGFLGVMTSGESSFTWPCTLAGSPASNTTLGPKSQFVNLASSSTTAVFALVGDTADIFWVQVPFGGNFTWKVDSGSTTSVSTNGGSIVDGKVTHISLGTAGAHTLTLAGTSSTASMTGVAEYNGDYAAGITVHDCGHFGWTAANWVTVLANGSAGPAAAIASLTPNLVIITLGVNDQLAGTTPATFGANLQAIITDLKAQLTSPYPAFLINMLPPRTGQSGYTYPWSQYVAAAWAVALADTSGPGSTPIVTVLDYTQGPRLPGADTDVYGFWQAADLVHPSNLGHQAIADWIMNYLTAA